MYVVVFVGHGDTGDFVGSRKWKGNEEERTPAVANENEI